MNPRYFVMIFDRDWDYEHGTTTDYFRSPSAAIKYGKRHAKDANVESVRVVDRIVRRTLWGITKECAA